MFLIDLYYTLINKGSYLLVEIKKMSDDCKMDCEKWNIEIRNGLDRKALNVKILSNVK